MLPADPTLLVNILAPETTMKTITTIDIMNLAAKLDATARVSEAAHITSPRRICASADAEAEQAVEDLEAALSTFADQLTARANAAGASGPAKAISRYLAALAAAQEAHHDVDPPTAEMRAAMVELTSHRQRLRTPKRPGGNPYTPHYLSGFEVGEIESGS